MPSDPRFYAAVHPPNRLRLCAALRVVDRMEFRALRDVLELSDATLSKTIGALVDAGYVRTTKASSRRATTPTASPPPRSPPPATAGSTGTWRPFASWRRAAGRALRAVALREP
ncbi:transcriptional regulator [Luteimicrobium sp. DT211]|uniref:transcriptional regulator n=1 Tax=Luteimicrobium sp. DT211 TaxID=3393412 RepID=UPI003CF9AA0B